MKIIAIGDVHGRSTWEEIVQKEHDADKIIFIGDYVDSFYVSPEWQLANLKKLLGHKEENKDQVVILTGNHDYHYIADDERYSGYNEDFADEFRKVYEAALDKGLMQMAYEHDYYLFTHAGVTNTFCEEYNLKKNAKSINKAFILSPEIFAYDRRDSSGYGESVIQSPIWVRPDSLMTDLLPKFVQVVGHTTQKSIKYNVGPEGNGFILIDVAGKGEYLKLTENSRETMTI